MNKQKVLFLDILTDNPQTKRQIDKEVYGGKNYYTVFCKIAGLKKARVSLVYASSQNLPKLKNFSAVIVGGSTLDPINGQDNPWMKNVYKYIRQIVKQGVPLLGICGGVAIYSQSYGWWSNL